MNISIHKYFGFLFCLLFYCGCPITQRATPIPCQQSVECFPGFECINESCTACGTVCSENIGEGVSSRGGSYCGADNVCIQIPANALTKPRSVYIEKSQEITQLDGIAPLSPIYRILPSPLETQELIQIEIPVANTVTPTATFIYQADDKAGPWTKLTGTSTFATAIGKANYLHYFVAGNSID